MRLCTVTVAVKNVLATSKYLQEVKNEPRRIPTFTCVGSPRECDDSTVLYYFFVILFSPNKLKYQPVRVCYYCSTLLLCACSFVCVLPYCRAQQLPVW